MSLNEITLSPYLLTQMYPSSLIESKKTNEPLHVEAGEQKDLSSAIDWKSLGNNQKKVLIVVNYDNIANLPDPQLDFLTQLLKACQLSLNDIALINVNNYKNADSTEILNHFDSRIVLLFGISPQQFGFPFDTPPFQVQNFANYTVTHAPALESLENDKPAKGQLWTSLKKIFNL
ncbi:hypothetical protein [Niabella ginsengisoli]|uniref:Uncharacterized protein n=1 Tax=Niabella ginsengisoli TaxID=522298 RepID=A0ABS9SFR1_9BACT|nr:hypothetical protein [Niabella ginsengisoli]MCH5597185.1 hypothetical protein [Niabella ginsengisoli]